MSDETPALPPPEPLPPPESPPPPADPNGRGPKALSWSQGGNLVPWIYGLGFVVLIFALLWIWQNPNPSPDALRPSQITDLVNQVENLTIRWRSWRRKNPKALRTPCRSSSRRCRPSVDRLPKPAPPPDLAPLQQQIAALREQDSRTSRNLRTSADLAPWSNRSPPSRSK